MGLGIKTKIKEMPGINRYFYAKALYEYYKNSESDLNRNQFVARNIKEIKIVPSQDKTTQICKAIKSVNIHPSENASFFYSVDPYTKVTLNYQILDNYSIDYSWVVNSFLDENLKTCGRKDAYATMVRELEKYLDRAYKLNRINEKNFNEIHSLFTRPAEHFHEAIQRILFVNQWLWQTGHKHNGLGHLDWILYDLYSADIKSGYITEEQAKAYLRDFFLVLHDKCWYKSTMLLGDTGQIVILGGIDENGEYRYNELTYLFIEISKELKLPDPKVLLRVSRNMPDSLLVLAIECIATGIGAPFLSNDDAVIPALIQYGYDSRDAYDYATSACWEPLTIGKSCDQNNIQTINFCKPFVDFIDSEAFESCRDIDEVKQGYCTNLSNYINQFLSRLDEKVFEEDPLLTLFSPEVLKTGKDIVRGGAKYANLGVTSVGLSTVVNSLMNLDQFVFKTKKWPLHELNEIRKKNYEGYEELRKELDRGAGAFGEDRIEVINLTNDLLRFISAEFHKHQTKLGGNYKFGLSSPNYIVDARDIGATFDGRRVGMPFGTHISGKNGLSPTELIGFASQLDYNDNRINGNVIDLIMSPDFLKKNMSKAVAMIKGGIRQGFYQLQINVVDSKTLIEAQKHPDQFPFLVVRVWGFSAYFKDLPKEYQDNLIRRVIEAEQTA